jgi:hypothetical protein
MQAYPQRISGRSEKRRQHYTKTNIPVPVVGIVPIAVSTAHVPRIIVERAATQHTGCLSGPTPAIAVRAAAYCLTL